MTIHHDWNFLLSGRNICLTMPRMNMYASAIAAKTGLPNLSIFGFIDGTLRAVCMPTWWQGSLYNGKDRVHGFKYQGLEVPDGMIAHLHGPHPGYLHDSNVYLHSVIADFLEWIIDDSDLVISGDPAYALRRRMMVGYRGVLTPAQAQWNKQVNAARISVEWGFGKVIALWATLDYKKNQKVFLQRVGFMYPVAVLLTNIHTCYYYSQTSDYFNISPVSAREYLDRQFDV